MTRRGRLFCTSRPYRGLARAAVLPWALQGETLTGHVLEIGSGSGAMAAALLDLFPQVQHLVATDYDERMVAAATTSLQRYGDRAVVERADATSLRFENNTFDAVCSFAMLHHVLRWEDALREAVRVLKPGGRLLGYDILGNRAMLALHGDKDDTRMIRPGELTQCLTRLPVDFRVHQLPTAIAGRFVVTKRAT
ncbi:MAG TPA: class I SAM-dependent methyltransferase [Mycobacteriales bacterium]|nr:class I SAM-dependent methyltransferase [Mycobacteriales bacterium]